jgi:ABC-2 type transport system permease protein
MICLLRAEAAKLLSLRATYLALAVTIVGAAGLTALITHTLATGSGDLTMRREVLTIAGASIAPVMALLVGMLVVGSEFRHNTITPVLLVTPLRRRVFLAKAAIAAAAATVIAALATTAGLGSAAVTLAAVGSAPLLDAGDIAGLAAASVALSVLYGVAGIGIATLVRNPTTALIAAMSALFVLDPVLSLLVPAWTLPGGATELVGNTAVTPQPTPLWVAAGVLAGYVVAIGAATLRVAVPRDIT